MPSAVLSKSKNCALELKNLFHPFFSLKQFGKDTQKISGHVCDVPGVMRQNPKVKF